MSGVVVVTDSSTCLPAALAARFAIQVLPISTYIAEEDFEQRSSSEDVVGQISKELEAEELSGANHPFVTEYLAAIETPGYEAAVVVTPAIEFATMFRNAVLASELSSRPALAIDARTAAAGQALVVLAAAKAAAAGADLDTVAAIAEEAARRVELFASLSTTEQIKRSPGAMPKELFSADAAGGRSIFKMTNGSIELLEGTSSDAEMLEIIAGEFTRQRARGISSSAVFHAGARGLAAQLEELLGGVDFVSGFSVAMQIHTGQGVVGAAWLPAEPDGASSFRGEQESCQEIDR